MFTIYNFSFFVLATAGARCPPLTPSCSILYFIVCSIQHNIILSHANGDGRFSFYRGVFAFTTMIVGSFSLFLFCFFFFYKRRLLDGGTDALRDVVLRRARKIDLFANAVRGWLVSRFVHARVRRRSRRTAVEYYP